MFKRDFLSLFPKQLLRNKFGIFWPILIINRKILSDTPYLSEHNFATYGVTLHNIRLC